MTGTVLETLEMTGNEPLAPREDPSADGGAVLDLPGGQTADALRAGPSPSAAPREPGFRVSSAVPELAAAIRPYLSGDAVREGAPSLGRSLALDDGDLVLDGRSHDLALVAGADALGQALELAVATQTGSDPLNVRFGFDRLAISAYADDLTTRKEFLTMELVRCPQHGPPRHRRARGVLRRRPAPSGTATRPRRGGPPGDRRRARTPPRSTPSSTPSRTPQSPCERGGPHDLEERYGVGEDGFVVKGIDRIIADQQTRARAMFGDDVDLTSGSALRKVLDAAAFDTHELWRALESQYYGTFVSTAQGPGLDLLGCDLGLRRRELRARGTVVLAITNGETDRRYAFPQGTVVVTEPAPDQPVLAFRSARAAVLSVEQSTATVEVEAVTRGAAGNIDPRTTLRLDPRMGPAQPQPGLRRGQGRRATVLPRR